MKDEFRIGDFIGKKHHVEPSFGIVSMHRNHFVLLRYEDNKVMNLPRNTIEKEYILFRRDFRNKDGK